ncbi:hypothetical protein [Deinococcus sp. QL22]|uniref:hypothetical protein n=1 Tax=Deinococcus sp. QL22 TaxID=2939437 RepID=UPI002017EF4D|nr:hypothetical protein [Deinococcus sp. QL22]UQN10377.1 hypothetical protein M1R55_29945 [Deinococcus sp. QL22]UQN10511.1 hypothetical protein M1R55_29270 [Deinococcus sp. QL22]
MGGERLSRDPDDHDSWLGYMHKAYAGYPNDDRKRLTDILRGLAQRDEDVAGTHGDYLAIVNPGHSLEFVGGARAVKLARQELDLLLGRLYPEGGGVDGLINNQIGELLFSPASSLEWVPTPGRDGVASVAIVPAEDIACVRDSASGAIRHEQVGVGVEGIQLDPLTYCYAPLSTAGASPYGVPMFLAALESLERKRRLTAATDRVIDLMRQVAVVAAEIPMPTPKDLGVASESDPLFEQRKQQWFETALSLIIDRAETGLFVGPSGTKFSVTNVTHSLQGIPDVTKENSRRVFSALGTTSFLRGQMDGATEALARVVYPMVEARATNIQAVIARQIEFGLNLHLRLKGIPATVYVRFGAAQSGFASVDAETEQTRMKTVEIGKKVFGRAFARRAADTFDLGDAEDAQAPPWAERWDEGANGPVPEASTLNPATRTAHGEPLTRMAFAYDRRTRTYHQTGLKEVREAPDLPAA